MQSSERTRIPCKGLDSLSLTQHLHRTECAVKKMWHRINQSQENIHSCGDVRKHNGGIFHLKNMTSNVNRLDFCFIHASESL